MKNTGQRYSNHHGNKYMNTSKKVPRKNDSSCTTNRKCKVKYTKNKTRTAIKVSAIMSMIEQMMKPELARKSENRNLLKTVSAGCVKDNERQCNIF